MVKKTTKKVTTTKSSSSNSDDILAVVAYLTIAGWIVTFLLNRDKNNSFVRYHEKQSLAVGLIGLLIAATAGIVGYLPFGSLVISLASLFVLVLAILGIINALNTKKEPLPVIGKYAEEKFKW
jgi:uncharacterized membrane protein